MIPRSLFAPLTLVTKKIKRMLYALSVLSLASLSVCGVLIYHIVQSEQTHVDVQTHSAQSDNTKIQYTSNEIPLDHISTLFQGMLEHVNLTADAAYAIAWNTKTNTFYDLYAHNSQQPYNAASITKLVTALTLAKTATMHSFVDTTPNASAQEDEIGNTNFPKSFFTEQDLIAAMLIQSSNKSAYTLANTVAPKKLFVHLMNTEAKKLGLSESVLRDPSGLDDHNANLASYMSPRDVARVSFELVSRYPTLTHLSTQSQYVITDKNGKAFLLHNTNPLVAKNDNILLSKTGYTGLAGGNMTMVIEPKPGIWVALVVMKSTLAERAHDMQTLVDTTNRSFEIYDKLALDTK